MMMDAVVAVGAAMSREVAQSPCVCAPQPCYCGVDGRLCKCGCISICLATRLSVYESVCIIKCIHTDACMYACMHIKWTGRAWISNVSRICHEFQGFEGPISASRFPKKTCVSEEPRRKRNDLGFIARAVSLGAISVFEGNREV